MLSVLAAASVGLTCITGLTLTAGLKDEVCCENGDCGVVITGPGWVILVLSLGVRGPGDLMETT